MHESFTYLQLAFTYVATYTLQSFAKVPLILRADAYLILQKIIDVSQTTLYKNSHTDFI